MEYIRRNPVSQVCVSNLVIHESSNGKGKDGDVLCGQNEYNLSLRTDQSQ